MPTLEAFKEEAKALLEQHKHLRGQKMLDERYASMSSEEKAAKQKQADKMITRYLRKHPEYTQST